MKKRINGKIKRKRLQSIVLGTALILSLAGCGAAANEEEKAARDAASEGVETENGAEDMSATAATESTEDTNGTAAEDADEASAAEGEDGISSASDSDETEGKKPVTMAGLVKESKQEQEGEQLPETILWFNATYAPLTYSNGWNWRLLGGREPTEDNKQSSKDLLEYSWSVKDRESALETTKSLLQNGHRKKCLDDTKQMEEWGILELGEEEFVQQLLTKDLDDEPGRYAVAYLIHQAGIEPEFITAWDLCRVNQLYADYYFCGYMTYEEAMDASLANSLNLQELYSSWEEMAEAYLLGYQFWQGEPILNVSGYDYGYDSPSQERRHYYEMLQEMEDGPYTLDWNMELKKSW